MKEKVRIKCGLCNHVIIGPREWKKIVEDDFNILERAKWGARRRWLNKLLDLTGQKKGNKTNQLVMTMIWKHVMPNHKNHIKSNKSNPESLYKEVLEISGAEELEKHGVKVENI